MTMSSAMGRERELARYPARHKFITPNRHERNRGSAVWKDQCSQDQCSQACFDGAIGKLSLVGRSKL